ncbi:hypothetical protein BMETH_1515_0 [methanotrophic bacterial endosymbiont of Bathymodiolus sp.]|nr:hypothetical protein BMETH_1515_0 [methanotrophic bacterial endosymbiont of Bathymodiolus sp.]
MMLLLPMPCMRMPTLTLYVTHADYSLMASKAQGWKQA